MTRIDKLRRLLEQEPDDAFLNFGLAMELVKEGKTEEALQAFDQVVESDPLYSAAHFHKGNTLIGLGRLDEARAALEQGVSAAESAGDPHALREMRELLASIGST